MEVVAIILVAIVGVVAFFFILVPLLRVIGRFVAHVFRFLGSEIGDVLRIFGGLLTSVVFAPLVVLSVIVGRWSAARHYAGAIQDEVAAIGFALYRIVIGNPARLLGLTALTDGIENRVPEAMAKAPGRDKPRRSAGQFDGYKIVGSIAGGGSGARLYVAEPDDIKRAAFERRGVEVDQVVIKSFSLKEGSSLPQIIREGRALEAAKKIGLVLEHDLTDQRFFYVMPYVPGDALGTVTQRMHDASGGDGLDDKRLIEALGYVSDLLSTLERYHRAGLWHKDVKPDNIIIHEGRAHVVDLGLVTPLRSAMTLTTHGTEYFRDPELVRMALKGVKVHEVNGVKFDVYAAGAVLYSAIENSFPAHGGLSHLTKRCPDTVRWIIRRAMTDYNNRYNSASEMMADLDAVRLSGKAFAMRPADLPSMNGQPAPVMAEAPADVADFTTVNAGHAAPAAAAAGVESPARPGPRGPRQKPQIRQVHWLTGRYVPEAQDSIPVAGASRGRGTRSLDAGAVSRIMTEVGVPTQKWKTWHPWALIVVPRIRGGLVEPDDRGLKTTLSDELRVALIENARHLDDETILRDALTVWIEGGNGFNEKKMAGALVRRWSSGNYRSGSNAVRTPRVPRDHRAPASEQLKRARQRAEAARRRAHERVRDRASRRRYSNSPNRGVLTTVFVFMVVVAAVAGAAIKKASESRGDRGPLVVLGPGHPNDANVQIQFNEKDVAEFREFLKDEWDIDTENLNAEDVHAIATVIEERVGSFLGRVTKQIPGARGMEATAPKAPQTIAVVGAPDPEAPSDWGALEGQRWLVLSDVGESADETQRSAVTQLIEAMRIAGSAIIDASSDEPSAIDLLASIRATLGTVQPGDPAAGRLIDGWLVERSATLDGLVWLPSPTGREVQVQVYSPDETTEQQARSVLQRVSR